jgi:hypothetical protein
MTDNSAAAIRPNIEEAAALRAEAGRLEQLRAWQHARFRWSFVGTFAAVVMGLIIGGVSGHLAIMLMPAAILSVATTSFFAMERGRHPAWGILSIPGLAVLNEMPDCHAIRLDEIERQLSGSPSKRVEDKRLEKAFFLPVVTLGCFLWARENETEEWRNQVLLGGALVAPFGLYHASRLIVETRRRGLFTVLPIAAMIWACLMTGLAATMIASIVERVKSREEVLAGDYAVLRLPPGWERNPAAKAAGVDLSAMNRKKNYYLTVSSVPKSTVSQSSLEEFALARVEEERTRIGTKVEPDGPRKRTVGGREMLLLEVRQAGGIKPDTTYRLAFWQTENRIYLVIGSGSTFELRSNGIELHEVMDAVKTVED